MYVVKIFYSYARQDQRLRDELERHLEPLKRSGQITTWYDRKIMPGKNWKQEVENHLNTADIILLLLSPDFVSSDYCYGQEMRLAITRQVEGNIHIIPVILRPVKWQELPIGNLQALPTNGKPVSSWRRREDAFEDITQGIHQVVMNYQLRKTNEKITQQAEEDTVQQARNTGSQIRSLSLFTNQFLIDMHHVLRNPLTTLGGYLELVTDFDQQLDEQQRNSFLKNATYSFEESMLMINWLTDLMPLQNQPVLKEFSFTRVVQKAIVAINPTPQIQDIFDAHMDFPPKGLAIKVRPEDIVQIQGHPLTLDFPEDLVIKADETYIVRVMINLLSNACRYTPIDTPVSIHVTVFGNREELTSSSLTSVLVCVKDFGPGIPPDELPRLFEPFQRLRRDLVGKIQGIGLGLYVSKKLVETHEGHIWAESTGVLGEGSRFYFTLSRSKVFKEDDDLYT